ncbi:peptidoglycan endopeptidase [Sphingomonas sp.]|uniref:peptidoglycan endopeptidase n=1 Tax=Sphingomonas sp. TaxID=28214 RepID=UPI001D43E8DE|nr:peptidoglycan endopeptidase [Sphingomonas sp.]MBX9796087.1 peptidoglycan endopeptidase [Sphingomonas sp.]
MNAVVAAARGCIGVRFRLHGRCRDHGFDCVGLVAHACHAAGCGAAVPSGYGLRSGDPARVAAAIAAAGLVPAPAPRRPGDVMLFASGPGQLHLAIASEAGIIHADAALRCVVERPGAPPWPLIAAWRLPEQE